MFPLIENKVLTNVLHDVYFQGTVLIIVKGGELHDGVREVGYC